MGVLGIGLGLFFPVAGVAGLALRFLAPALFSSIAGPVVSGAKVGWSVVKGLNPRTIVAGLGGIGGALALLASLWGVWRLLVHHHDKGVIAQHEAVVQNEVRAEVNTATVKADVAQNVQAAADAERHAGVVAGVNAAVAAHPEEARHATGPASQAALDRLRRK